MVGKLYVHVDKIIFETCAPCRVGYPTHDSRHSPGFYIFSAECHSQPNSCAYEIIDNKYYTGILYNWYRTDVEVFHHNKFHFFVEFSSEIRRLLHHLRFYLSFFCYFRAFIKQPIFLDQTISNSGIYYELFYRGIETIQFRLNLIVLMRVGYRFLF